VSAPKSRRAALFIACLGAFLGIVLVPSASATYPGHNGLIAFNAVTGDHNQLFTVRSNGHALRQITHVDGDALFADWSPDGRRIAFEFDPADGSGASVEIMNADGSGIVNLTPEPACCQGQPSFTPDGKRIVFERVNIDTGDDAIWSMRTDGTDQRRIIGPFAPGIGFATEPNVSPDGRILSFVGFDGSIIGPAGEPAQGLFTSTVTGAGLKQLMPFDSDQSVKTDWSPDGKLLLGGVNANFLHPSVGANIFTIHPDGTGFRQLTHYPAGTNAFAGSYSPNGQWIVFRLEQNNRFALSRMRDDGHNLHAILPFSDTFKPRNSDWGPR
jgi:Tol biopolymer transport system component